MVSTLFIKELWTLIPYSSDVHARFPFSTVQITNQTYYSYACHYAVMIIVIMVMYEKFDSCRLVFGAWLLLNILEFIEYFLTYNQAIYFPTFDGHTFNVNITNIKYLVIISLTIYKLLTWRI